MLRRKLSRLALAVVIALLLPFPGPHIDSYLPLIATIPEAAGADWGFFLIFGVMLLIYTAAAFGVLSFIHWRRARRKPADV